MSGGIEHLNWRSKNVDVKKASRIMGKMAREAAQGAILGDPEVITGVEEQDELVYNYPLDPLLEPIRTPSDEDYRLLPEPVRLYRPDEGHVKLSRTAEGAVEVDTGVGTIFCYQLEEVTRLGRGRWDWGVIALALAGLFGAKTPEGQPRPFDDFLKSPQS